MKLTKTETNLIEFAKAAFQRRGEYISSYQTGTQYTSGKPKSWGARERKAAIKLGDKGLLTVIDSYRYTHSKNGYSAHVCDVTYRLTDKCVELFCQ